MPYVRLYLPEVSTEQKRCIAHKLIEITVRTFHLRNDERCRVSIEFISLVQQRGTDCVRPSSRGDADFMVEVMGHDLTDEKKRGFAEEATATLAEFLPLKSKGRIARLLGIKLDIPCQIALQFRELSPAISEPFVVHPTSQAA